MPMYIHVAPMTLPERVCLRFLLCTLDREMFSGIEI